MCHGDNMFSVIFDMDGTLLDTQRICIPAWEYAGNLQGFKNAGDCIYSVCGMNEKGWTNFLESRYPTLDTLAFKRDMRDYIIKNGKIVFRKGAKELLDFLKQNNIKMAIASGSSRASINHHLNEVNATHYFSAIVGGRDIVNGKPAPDIFLKAAKLIGAQPQDCFVFEDSENGIKAGIDAGMKVIGFADIIPFKEETKKLLFSNLNDLSEAIDMFKTIL